MLKNFLKTEHFSDWNRISFAELGDALLKLAVKLIISKFNDFIGIQYCYGFLQVTSHVEKLVSLVDLFLDNFTNLKIDSEYNGYKECN